MAQMTHEEAIAKAVKLLKLAQSDNPNEAALAAARAQEIMDRYKLEGLSADYNSAAPAEPDEPIVAFGEPVEPKQGSEWVVRLILALARANQCRIYQRRTMEGTGTFVIGRPSDAQTVRYLYGWLKREVNRLANRDGRGYSAVWKNNFRVGAVDTIVMRLRESQRATVHAVRQEAEARNPGAIVKVDRALARIEQRTAAVDAWVYANMKLGKSRASFGGRGDYGAREAGRRAGHEIELNSKPAGALGSSKKPLQQ